MKLQPLQMTSLQSCPLGHNVFKESCEPCQVIQKEWYQYLERAGFEDIEKDGGRKETQLMRRMSKNVQTTEMFEANISYYQWAREKAQVSNFKSTTDRLIWEYHAEGLSRSEIAPRVGLEGSWISRKLQYIEQYLKHSIGSMSMVSA